MLRMSLMLGVLALVIGQPSFAQKDKEGDGLRVDKEKRTITIDAKVAPRKLPIYDKIYPIEVIASFAHPHGKKAHETVVTIETKPSAVHKALESLGLKPGKPLMGGKTEVPEGPEVNIYLEVPSPDGTPKRITMDKTLVDSRTGKPFPKNVKWRFTGSVVIQPDPEKDDKAYGADVSGTLGVIFPVTNQTVFQTNLSMEYEGLMKLETNSKVLPKEGTPVKLVIEVPEKK